jgi:hypothetical protein
MRRTAGAALIVNGREIIRDPPDSEHLFAEWPVPWRE